MKKFKLIGKNVVNPNDSGDLWVVSGRIPGYDDDAVFVVLAKSDEQALEVFTDSLARAHNLKESDWKEIEKSWGDRLFVNYTFKFADFVE